MSVPASRSRWMFALAAVTALPTFSLRSQDARRASQPNEETATPRDSFVQQAIPQRKDSASPTQQPERARPADGIPWPYIVLKVAISGMTVTLASFILNKRSSRRFQEVVKERVSAEHQIEKLHQSFKAGRRRLPIRSRLDSLQFWQDGATLQGLFGHRTNIYVGARNRAASRKLSHWG